MSDIKQLAIEVYYPLFDREIYASIETWKYDTVADYQEIEDI